MHSMGMNCTRRRHRTVKPVRTNIYTKQTGSQELGSSATNNPNQDPELFQTDQLERRLALYAKAGGNAGASLNNRAAI